MTKYLKISLFFLVLLQGQFLVAKDLSLRVKTKIEDSKGRVIDDCSSVVVFLEALERKIKMSKKTYTMNSVGMQFSPMILPILKGSRVNFPNKDRLLHNVFSLSKTKPFDLGLYKKGSGKFVDFEKSGMVKVFCNIHEQMTGIILVLDTPYFKQSHQCNFEFYNIPKGKYSLKVWYRYGKLITKKIFIDHKKNKTHDFSLIKGREIYIPLQKD